MFEFLANPFILLAICIPILTFMGIIIGVKVSGARGTTVLQLDPATNSAREFRAYEEDAVNVRCKPVGNIPPQQFIKRKNRGWNVLTKGFLKLKTYALWIGVVGSAYAIAFKDGVQVQVSLKEAIVNIFGEVRYNQLSKEHRDKIEEDELGVIVNLPEYVEPTDDEGLTSDDVHTGQFKQLIKAYTEGVNNFLKEGGGGGLSRIIFQVGTGVAIGIIVAFLFGIGKTEVIKV